MSSLDLVLGGAAPGVSRAGSATLVAEAVGSWAAARPRWAQLASRGVGLAFQKVPWLDAWYATCAGDGVPLVVFFKEQRSGRDTFALPLVQTREGAKRIIAFADSGLTDYNAPLLATDATLSTADGAAIWQALRSALPAADLLRFGKMPVTIMGRANPLAGLPGAVASTLIGNVLHVPGTWDEWHWGLERTFRKELERSSRVFEKHAGAAFARYRGPEAERVYGELKRLQAARIAELGLPYALDQEPARTFYDALVRDGLEDGSVVLTALTIGEEVVAALLGITDGTHYAMTRLATPDARWKNFSPGRMVIERTMRFLHEEGYRAFDFTIGDYSYKRRIGVTPVPMVDVTQPLSLLGWPETLKHRAKAEVRKHPALMSAVKRWRGVKSEPLSH